MKWSHALKMLTAGRLTADFLTGVLGSEETVRLTAARHLGLSSSSKRKAR